LANLATYRDALAATLAAAGRVVYAYPNENITPPAIVLVPGSPYITVSAIGGARCNVRFDITVIVNAADNRQHLVFGWMVTTHSPANRKRRHAYQPDQHRDGNNQLRKREKNYASNLHNWA